MPYVYIFIRYIYLSYHIINRHTYMYIYVYMMYIYIYMYVSTYIVLWSECGSGGWSLLSGGHIAPSSLGL